MTDDDVVNVTGKYFKELTDAHRMLDCLREAGVDNWEGYQNAVKLYNESTDGGPERQDAAVDNQAPAA